MKFYVDTNIWRDYFENRQDRFRPLGEWALRFFQYCNENNYEVLYSELIERELSKDYTDKKIKEVFKIMKTRLLREVELHDEIKKEAFKLSKELDVPKSDMLHAVLAKKNEAIIISRNRHFVQASGYVEVKKPEDII